MLPLKINYQLQISSTLNDMLQYWVMDDIDWYARTTRKVDKCDGL